METRKVKKVSFPHTFVIIFVMIVIAVGLTWVVPAGTYDFVKSASGRKVVDPATFHYIQSALRQSPSYSALHYQVLQQAN